MMTALFPPLEIKNPNTIDMLHTLTTYSLIEDIMRSSAVEEISVKKNYKLMLIKGISIPTTDQKKGFWMPVSSGEVGCHQFLKDTWEMFMMDKCGVTLHLNPLDNSYRDHIAFC